MNRRNEAESDPDATTRIYARRSAGVARVEPAHPARTHSPLPHPVRPTTGRIIPARVREVRARPAHAAAPHVPAAWQPSPPPPARLEPTPGQHHPPRSKWRLWAATLACACVFVIVHYLAALVRVQMGEDNGRGRLLPDLSVRNQPAQNLREPVSEPAAPAVEARTDRQRATPPQPAVTAWRRNLATERTDTRARHAPKSEVPSPQPATATQRDVTTASYPETATATQPDVTTASHPETATASQPDVTTASHPETATATQLDVTTAGHPEAATANHPEAATIDPNASAQTPVLRIVPLDADSPETDVGDAPLHEKLSRQQVQRGIEGVRKQLVACAGDRHGTSFAQLTISNQGRVKNSLIDGAFAGTPEGSCMARALRTARFPRFTSEDFTVRYPLRL